MNKQRERWGGGGEGRGKGRGSFLCPYWHLNAEGVVETVGYRWWGSVLWIRIRLYLYNALYTTTLIDIKKTFTVYAFLIMKVVYFIHIHISCIFPAKKVVFKSHHVDFSFVVFTLLTVSEVESGSRMWVRIRVAVLHTYDIFMADTERKTAVSIPHGGGIYPQHRY